MGEGPGKGVVMGRGRRRSGVVCCRPLTPRGVPGGAASQAEAGGREEQQAPKAGREGADAGWLESRGEGDRG